MSVNNDRHSNKKRLTKKNPERTKHRIKNHKETKTMKLAERERMKGKKERENHERLCIQFYGNKFENLGGKDNFIVKYNLP